MTSWDGTEERLLFGFEQIASAITADRRKVLEELNQLRALYLPVAFWYGNIIVPGNCLWKRCAFSWLTQKLEKCQRAREVLNVCLAVNTRQ